MEAAAMLAGEQHNYQPQCVAPTIRVFGMNLNDMMTDDERVRLVPFVMKVVGTSGDEMLAESEQRRAFLCADYAVRVFAPISLRAYGFEEGALTMENLPRIVDKQTAASAARYAGGYAAAAAAAARYAATDAAAAGYTSASAVAAGCAATDAAEYAFGYAGAAAAAAGAAARYAATDAAAAHRALVIDKAVELFSRMM